MKLDFDFSKGIVLDSRNKLAFHIGVGVGMAYGNSNYLPFERAYFSGGANSVRGWSVRELGPGSMEVDSRTSAMRNNVSRSGCDVFVHQRDTEQVFLPICSDSHFAVLFCSTSTTFILFSCFIQKRLIV